MKILKRGEILIVDSNLNDDTAQFDENTTYKKDDECVFEKYIYKALSEVKGIKPSEDTSKWQKMSVSNEWACFDYFLNTTSKAKKEFDIALKCVGAKAIYLHGLRAKFLSIELLDAQNGAVIESRHYNLWDSEVKSWSEYFFCDFADKDRARNVYYECKSVACARIFRVRAWGIDEIECGSIICGQLLNLALTLYDKNSISMIDFSKVTTDEEGNTQLTKGNFKRTNAFEMVVEDKDLDEVVYKLTQIRGEACVFVISDYYECLINFAFLKNHEILLSKPPKSIISVEIEGLV